MAIATFRWAGAQRITEINKNDSVVIGVFRRTKSNSEPFYRDAPLEGIMNSPKWIGPTLKARSKYADSGKKPRFIFPHFDDDWLLGSPRPMEYATELACFRRLARLCGLGEKFTPLIPREFYQRGLPSSAGAKRTEPP